MEKSGRIFDFSNTNKILVLIGIVFIFVILCFFTYQYFVQTSQNPLFPVNISGKTNASGPIGFFEDSFIGTYNCTPLSETYSTNYTFISGSDGPHRVRFQFNLWNNSLMPESISDASIEPAELDVEPNHVYNVRAKVTVGPNVTGISQDFPGGGHMSWNPTFTFILHMFVDGKPAPDADDKLTVTKWCKSLRQTWEMQNSPSFGNPDGQEITMHAGESKTINITISTTGGGIREIHFESGGRLLSRSYGFPLDPTTLIPLPDGMNVSFIPPVVIASNFKNVNQTLAISTSPDTPPGEYFLPLVLCYRNFDRNNRTSTYFSFVEHADCPTMGIFIVKVLSFRGY